MTIKSIFLLFWNRNQWLDYKIKSSKMSQKWETTRSDIKKAKSYQDWRTVQKLQAELLWLKTLWNFERDYRLSLKFPIKLFATSNRLDSMENKEMEKDVYCKFREKDFVIPISFDASKDLHKKFGEEVAMDFESIIRQSKFEGLAVCEESLPFPKDFINSTLLFYKTYCKSYSQVIDTEYVEEMRISLQSFI